ncbi:MAG: hypothetical protein KAH62_00895 [Desulfobacula sp.]|nr:hypothetical protein [Desulfobacula sp.]
MRYIVFLDRDGVINIDSSEYIKTGNGSTAAHQLSCKGITPDFIGSDLYETALWIIKNVKI